MTGPPLRDGREGRPSFRLVAIGASTGGPQAVENVLLRMPPRGPGILITQHIPKQFSASLAERLNRETALRVKEAEDGEPVLDGSALLAPGGLHMRVAPHNGHWVVRLDDGPKLWHQKPSVDVMFNSVAQFAAPYAVGVLLTGMGEDGAAGLRRMRDAGCWTIVQDEASCVVYGMPRAAVEAGAVAEIRPLDTIAGAIQLALAQPVGALSRQLHATWKQTAAER